MADENCKGCGCSLSEGLVFNNSPSNCVDRVTFPYMAIGESMHMECYLDKMIKELVQTNLAGYTAHMIEMDKKITDLNRRMRDIEHSSQLPNR